MEGNQSISFEVEKAGVLQKIRLNSYYRGERLKEDAGAHAARMQAGSDNDDIIKNELELAAADVAAIVTRNLGRCTVVGSEDKLTFQTMAASNFPSTLKASVEGLISAYLYDKALESWMLINMPSEVDALAQRAVADAEKLRQLLVERSKE